MENLYTYYPSNQIQLEETIKQCPRCNEIYSSEDEVHNAVCNDCAFEITSPPEEVD